MKSVKNIKVNQDKVQKVGNILIAGGTILQAGIEIAKALKVLCQKTKEQSSI